jgi:uncharacterized membrane-anchored protein
MQFTGKRAAGLPRGVTRKVVFWLSLVVFGVGASSFAADPPVDPMQAQKVEFEAAMKAASAVMKVGPTDVPLLDQAQLKVPANDVFVPMPEAARLMRAMGNRPDDSLAGVIMPKDDLDWLAVVRYEKSGYVKDDEARDWNVDELFTSIKDGTEQGNEERRQRGFPELDVVGWVEKPRYDATNHRLVWSMAVRQKGAPAGSEQSVNYNTYALGRDGFFSINFITGQSEIEADKPLANGLLAGLDYKGGKRYADFNASSDHVAEFGIAALVAGVAAKKLGLIALLAAFALKWVKILVVAGVAILAGVKKFFKRGPPKAPPGTPPTSPPGSDLSAG